MGGGTVVDPLVPAPAGGLSPRGRGNRQQLVGDVDRQRSIPAGAGEPGPGARRRVSTPVYPRGGGGTEAHIVEITAQDGLSPRGRGNHNNPNRPHPIIGSIPAGAGEPETTVAVDRLVQVYPRGGGGTPWLSIHIPSHKGLSPRGRGNPLGFTLLLLRDRSIPAGAGEPVYLPRLAFVDSVYPRGGGGTGE